MTMPKINVKVDPRIINSCYRPYLNDFHPVQIFYGGSSSGKSYFLAQRCILDMLQGGHNYLIVRKVARTLRKSTFNEITKAISAFKVAKFFKINSSDLVITGPNGYQILFAGADDPEKIKSITPSKGVIDTIWCEEATEFEYADIKQLQKRLRGRSQYVKRMVLSFNPIHQTHWLYKEFFAGHWSDDSSEYHDDNLQILKTTYRNNEFLTPDDIAGLENETDPYWKAVYCDGKWGILGHAIFTNWSTSDLSDKVFDVYENGLDFGFSNAPTALVRTHYSRRENTLYVLDARYRYSYTNDLIAAECKNMFSREVVTCDCAEPKSIAELRQLGVTAVPTVKGPDSIRFGIQWLQKLHIVIDSRLTEAVNEFTTYHWQEDAEGNVIPKPVDKDNHIIDAIRYAQTNNMRNNSTATGDNKAWAKLSWGAM